MHHPDPTMGSPLHGHIMRPTGRAGHAHTLSQAGAGASSLRSSPKRGGATFPKGAPSAYSSQGPTGGSQPLTGRPDRWLSLRRADRLRRHHCHHRPAGDHRAAAGRHSRAYPEEPDHHSRAYPGEPEAGDRSYPSADHRGCPPEHRPSERGRSSRCCGRGCQCTTGR